MLSPGPWYHPANNLRDRPQIRHSWNSSIFLLLMAHIAHERTQIISESLCIWGSLLLLELPINTSRLLDTDTRATHTYGSNVSGNIGAGIQRDSELTHHSLLAACSGVAASVRKSGEGRRTFSRRDLRCRRRLELVLQI